MSFVFMVLVSIFFSLFVFLDAISHMQRLAGSVAGLNGLGFAFQTMVNTLKRIFVVLFPPTLGFVSVYGSKFDVFASILLAHVAGAVSLVIFFLMRVAVFRFSYYTIKLYSEGGGVFNSIMEARNEFRGEGPALDLRLSLDKVNGKLVTWAVWVFFFYASSGFLVNIAALMWAEYSTVILQLTGVLNAFGTIALAFFLDPQITRIYESKNSAERVFHTLYVAQVINICFVSPIIYLILGFFVL
ncbi:Protein of unknown function [Meinhardsimonia xiamenensis]|jgi:hypothetical protein|uniref:Uncharacterized protein n=1 Tax=Meinhardsimonia xiamenensis TaxID=990712 RepID=A0A1G9HQA7_9RHOB|nr:DUF2837 family protein [Meinhardsimonia xiamenensis]PRX26636.1 uncharacterized protein DUF2837 [Meinhardsimonia xiamenensis]SDL15042.1 Protein of unknown function [Meinhardsimonia xiamenensis]